MIFKVELLLSNFFDFYFFKFLLKYQKLFYNFKIICFLNLIFSSLGVLMLRGDMINFLVYVIVQIDNGFVIFLCYKVFLFIIDGVKFKNYRVVCFLLY